MRRLHNFDSSGYINVAYTMAKVITEPEKPESILTRYGRAVVQSAAAITALGFVFYGLGYVIVNLNFSQLGVRAFGLVNAIYLPAGVAFVAVAVMPLLILLGIMNYLLRVPRRPQWSLLLAPLALTAVYLVVQVVFLMLFVRPDASAAASTNDPSFMAQGAINYGRYPLWAGALALTSFLSLGIIRLATDEPGEMLGSLVFPIVIILALLFLLTLFSWARNVYPVGAPEVGGGRTVDVSLVLQPPDGMSPEAFGASLGLEMTGPVSERVRLLYEDANSITVLLSSGIPVKIDSGGVLGIRYFPGRN